MQAQPSILMSKVNGNITVDKSVFKVPGTPFITVSLINGNKTGTALFFEGV